MIYLLPMLDCAYNIINYRYVEAPFHGVDFVNGLHDTDKKIHQC